MILKYDYIIRNKTISVDKEINYSDMFPNKDDDEIIGTLNIEEFVYIDKLFDVTGYYLIYKYKDYYVLDFKGDIISYFEIRNSTVISFYIDYAHQYRSLLFQTLCVISKHTENDIAMNLNNIRYRHIFLQCSYYPSTEYFFEIKKNNSILSYEKSLKAYNTVLKSVEKSLENNCGLGSTRNHVVGSLGFNQYLYDNNIWNP